LRIPDYIANLIIFILEPLIIFVIIMSHPRTPSLAIAVFTICKCLYISHLCGPSGISLIVVIIFDRCSPEHNIVLEDAGLTAKALVTMVAAIKNVYFIVNSSRKNGRI
jgi:hypothetical protein